MEPIGLKRVIFGETFFIPADTIVEVEVFKNGLFDLHYTRREGEKEWGIPYMEIIVIIRLCHANFPGNNRKLETTILFKGATEFSCPNWMATRETDELRRIAPKVIEAFVGVDNAIIDAYLAGKKISTKTITDYFLQNYRYKGYRNRRFVLDV